MRKKIHPLTTLTATVICAGLTISNPAFASTNTGKIGYIAGAGGSIAYVTIVSPTNAYATCANQKRYVINLSSVGGRAMFAIALAAKTAGQQVTVLGSGACSVLPGDAEDVNNIATDGF